MYENTINKEMALESDPYSLFLFGIRSPKTREKLICRFEMFLNFLDLPREKGSLQERCNYLVQEIKKKEKENNTSWITHKVISYLQYQKKSYGDIQKISCVNSNINVNGIDITKIPTDDLATAEASNEGLDGASNQNGNGIADRINFDKNLVNICVNVNQNDQLKVGPPEEPATLTVNKEIFGCSTTDQFSMDCDELSPDSSSWLPCIGSSISTSQFCQRLQINFFDIEVLDDQDTQLQQFEGSTTGTTIQNLPAGTYTVNEIKGTSGFDRLQSLPTVEQNCISRGFDGGGSLATSSDPILTYFICFDYEDEQGNDCSDVTLAAGEDKTCTVKNYISFVRQGD